MGLTTPPIQTFVPDRAPPIWLCPENLRFFQSPAQQLGPFTTPEPLVVVLRSYQPGFQSGGSPALHIGNRIPNEPNQKRTPSSEVGSLPEKKQTNPISVAKPL